MRKICCFLFLFALPFLLFAQDRKLTITLNQQPISKLFKEIEQQCHYNFVYSDEIVTDTIKISLTAKNLPVTAVLSAILPEKQLYHQMVNERLIAIGSRKYNPETQITSKFVFTGTIEDAKGNIIPFASVGLFEGTVRLNGSISNEKGSYQLSHDFLLRHPYKLKVSSVGYLTKEITFIFPDTNAIRHIILAEDRQTLKTVSVTGTKPLMERRTDRFIVNVEDSFLANGLNGLEVLQKSPGIWVDSDGSIKIKGNQSVMVMINDVVQRMSGNDLAEYLRTLKSEEISKIEIISSPPSEFEAAGTGGIVHIILKRSRMDGLVGSLNSVYRQLEKRSSYSLGTTLNYKVKNLYLFGNIAAGKDHSDYIASYEISYPNQDLYTSHTDRYNNNGTLRYQVGGSYDLGKNKSISFQSMQTANRMNQYFNTYVNFLGTQPLTGAAHSEWYRKPQLNSHTLNYVWKIDSLGSGLKVLADYVYSTRTELNNFSSVYSLASKSTTFRNNTPNTTNLFSIQTDYTKAFSKSIAFRSGLKFAATKRDNEVLNENLIAGSWVLNANLSNRFIYRERLSMAYASLEKSWKHFSIKGGLRAEHTHMEGNSITANQQFVRNYIGFFPSVFINQKLDEEKGSSVYLSYSRRLQRPSFSDLNPYRLQFDNYLTQLGNPDLTPEYTHKFDAGILFWKNWSAEIYFAHTRDKVAQLANPVANNIIEYQNRNFNSSNEYGFSLFAPIKIYQWWTMNNYISGYNLRYQLNDFDVNQATFSFTLQHAITVKDFLNIDVSTYYRSPYVGAVTRYGDVFNMEMALGKRFFDKRLQLRSFISDIFNTAREKEHTDYLGTTIDFYQKRPTRVIGISLSYSFSSGKKFNNKKIEQSNDDEKRRIGN
ncbi:MAG: outer membrane beta-barrel family protein [Pedobacter sp.]|nr:outer membrane beta-barrel family protein [Pedobacter sp.]MDQ8054543.1 outer membrane beta-barrel family protein [Pedobacter sp.]